MSLAHLFEQPVVTPKPTRVVRAGLDVEPQNKHVLTPARKAALAAMTRRSAEVRSQAKAQGMTPAEREQQRLHRQQLQRDWYARHAEAQRERSKQKWAAHTPEQRERYAAAARKRRSRLNTKEAA